MKRIWIHLFSLLSILCFSFILGSCDSESPVPPPPQLHHHFLYVRIESSSKKDLLKEIITDHTTPSIDKKNLPVEITVSPTTHYEYNYQNAGPASNANHSLMVFWLSDVLNSAEAYHQTLEREYTIGLQIPLIFGDTQYHPLTVKYLLKEGKATVKSAKFNGQMLLIQPLSGEKAEGDVVTITIP